MPLYTLKNLDPNITIKYGTNSASGVFLSILDKRLEWRENVSQEVNSVAMVSGLNDGDGSYFDIYTGENGFGKKVSINTMITYLERYGVPKKHIEALLDGQRIELMEATEKSNQTNQIKIEKLCFSCKNKTTKKCVKCEAAYYCTKECQVKDWSIHKLICDYSLFPNKTAEKSVMGILLPETGTKPIIVEVPLEFSNYLGESFYRTKSENFILKKTGMVIKEISCHYITENRSKPNRKLKNTLLFEYRDNVFNDGSLPNTTIREITKHQMTHDWRGSVLITKMIGKPSEKMPDYIDIELNDFIDVIDYLKWYGS